MSKSPEMSVDEFIAAREAAGRHVRMLQYLQIGLAVLCGVALIAIILIKIMGGPSRLITPLGIVMMLAGVGITIADRKAKPFYAQFEMIQRVTDQEIARRKANGLHSVAVEGVEDIGASKIPLTIGFANLAGEDLSAIVSEDAMALSPLFARSRVVDVHQIPSAEILFVYAALNEDGTIQGPTPSGIRQIVQLTNAAIIVLASPNSSGSIQNAAALPGPKTANIVFTLSRNGSGFSQFFRELFEKMRDGKDMLSAWVELAPQGPNANSPHAPQTVLLAEGGKVAFPH